MSVWRVVLWRRLGLAAAAGAAGELAAVALMATATWLIVRAAGRPPMSVLALAIVGVRAFALGRGTCRYLERLAGHDAALRTLAALRQRVYAALVPHGSARDHSAERLTRLVADVDAVQELLIRCLLPAGVALAVTAGAITLSAVLLPAAGAALAAGLVLAGLVVPLAIWPVTARLGARTGRDRAALAARSLDLIDGAAELTVYGARAAAVAHADAAARRLARGQRGTARAESAGRAAAQAVQAATTLAVTALASSTPGLNPVLVPVLALTALTAFEILTPLPAAVGHLVNGRDATRRLTALLDRPAPLAEPARTIPLGSGPLTVELRGVRVRYEGAAAPALDGVDLRLEPGKRVALVGCNGSGKSTVLATLARQLPLESGRYLINGHPVGTLATGDVRARLGGATQDAYVFHASLRANLTLARPDAEETQVIDAVRRARLWEWVERLPDGLDTIVGQDGATMSGGQRQRLVLARALLADPRVLLLDEPVEGLDPDTAPALLAETLAATTGRTTVLVSHRLAGLDAVDEIVVLDAGRIVQRGTHADLAAVPGRYQELWHAERLGTPAAAATAGSVGAG